MPSCPIPGCEQYFMNEEDLGKHILGEHPEYTAPSADQMLEMVKAQNKFIVFSVAANLTSIVFGRDGADKEEVLRIFGWFKDRI